MAATEPAETNKTLVRRLIEEVVHERNYDILDELIADEFVIHGAVGATEAVTGREAYEASLQDVFDAFPDMTFSIEEILADGDLVAYRYTATGTHEGAFMGMPGSGTEVQWTGMSLARVEDGKLTELRGFADNIDLMNQLGLTELPDA